MLPQDHLNLIESDPQWPPKFSLVNVYSLRLVEMP